MPVDFETHEPGNQPVDLSEGTNERRLLTVLLQTPAVGYTLTELAEESEVPQGSIEPTLTRLEAAGLVRYEKPYWTAAEDDQIASAAASFIGLESAASPYSDDWYAQNKEWDEKLPDLSDEEL